MRCPNCGQELRASTREGVNVDECPQCGGTWFDRGELRRARDSADEDLRWLDFDVLAGEEAATGAQSDRKCPECGRRMEARTYMESSVVVDACPSQHGVWLDQGEFRRIIDYLEDLLVTSSSQDYARTALEELKEVVTGPGGRISEMKDFFAVVRLLRYRIGAEHPRVAQTLTDLGGRL
ncbi:MAG TPA: zf-TFIIB domain-containing protein [Acidimicrobiales bacterium]|nr:zf-TFIIB domain-containing protein [Acidimicrobiales bacterium]